VWAAACVAADSQQLIKRLASPYLAERTAAVAKFAELPPAIQKQLVPDVVKLLGSDARDAWFGQQSAALVLGRMGPAAKAAGPALKKHLATALAAKDWGLSDALFEALVQVDPEAGKAVVPILIKTFEGDDPRMARLALMMLKKSGGAGQAAVPTLIKAMKSADGTVVAGALDALAGIGPKAAPAIPQLRELLKHGDANIRAKALGALKSIGAPALPVLIAALEDENKTMVPAVVDALGEMEAVAQPAVPALVALSMEADAGMTQKIAAALKTIKAKNNPPAVEAAKARCVEGHSAVIALPVRDADDVASDVQAQIVKAPARGALTRQDRITFVYQAKPGFIGTDPFGWKATDGKAETAAVEDVVTIMADREGPKVAKAVVGADPSILNVRFNELVGPASAGRPENYTLGKDVKVIEAKPQPDGMSVVLKTSGLADNVDYTLTVANVLDRSLAKNAGGGAVAVIRMVPGIRYSYYRAQFKDFPDYDKLKAVKSGVVGKFQLVNPAGRPGFALRFEGIIAIPKDGEYTFFTQSDDGSRLFISGKQVVDNPGVHPVVEKSGVVKLEAGRYPVVLWFFDWGGGSAIRVLWQGPGIGKQDIPPGALFHRP